jgi:hypothetical protein
MISGIYQGLIFGPGQGLADGMIAGLAGALAGALMGAAGICPRQIDVVEMLRWSWLMGWRFALLGLAGGLIGRTVYGLVYRLGSGLAGTFPVWLTYGLTGGLGLGIIGGLVGGLTGDQLQTTVVPNQGIRRSGRSALCGGLVYGLAAGLVVGLIYGVAGGPQALLHTLRLLQAAAGPSMSLLAGWLARLSGGYPSGLRSGLIYGGLYGLIGGLIAGLAYRGRACLSHLALGWSSGAAVRSRGTTPRSSTTAPGGSSCARSAAATSSSTGCSWSTSRRCQTVRPQHPHWLLRHPPGRPIPEVAAL